MSKTERQGYKLVSRIIGVELPFQDGLPLKWGGRQELEVLPIVGLSGGLWVGGTHGR